MSRRELRAELVEVAALVETIAARKAAGQLTPDDERLLRVQAALKLERAVVLCAATFSDPEARA